MHLILWTTHACLQCIWAAHKLYQDKYLFGVSAPQSSSSDQLERSAKLAAAATVAGRFGPTGSFSWTGPTTRFQWLEPDLGRNRIGGKETAKTCFDRWLNRRWWLKVPSVCLLKRSELFKMGQEEALDIEILGLEENDEYSKQANYWKVQPNKNRKSGPRLIRKDHEGRVRWAYKCPPSTSTLLFLSFNNNC